MAIAIGMNAMKEIPSMAEREYSVNPAASIGVSDRKGSLQVGKDADIVVLNDDYSVEQTYCRGIAEK